MSALVKPTQQDRLLAVFRALIRSVFPRLTYVGVFEYVVQATDGVTVDAAPTDPTIPMPAITKVPIMTGLPGTTCTPKNGSRLGIAFLNGDPTRPVVLGVFDSSSDLFTPLISIAGGVQGAQGVARLGDAVGPFVVTKASTKVSCG